MPIKYNGMRIAWVLMLCMGLVVLAGGLLKLLLVNLELSAYSATIITQMLQLIPITIGALYLKREHGYAPLRQLMAVRGFVPSITFVLLLLPTATRYFASLVQLPVTRMFVQLFGNEPAGSSPNCLMALALMFISTCIVAPVLEELLFRGVVFKILEPYGSFKTIVVTALGFAMVHFDPSGLIMVFIIGVVLGFVRLYTVSTVACMLFHSLLNFGSLMQTVFQKDIALIINVLEIYVIVMICLFPILMFLMHKLYGKGAWYKGTVRGGNSGAVPMVVLMIIYLLMTLLYLF